jgi:hypothetical protein
MSNICNKCKIKNPKHSENNCPNCPKCGADPSHYEMRNYSMMWHEGDIYCTLCDTFIRYFDAG